MSNNHHQCQNNCLWKYRKAGGFKQKEVAAILRIKSTGEISRWEHGMCIPKTENLVYLAQLYRRPMEALIIDFVREAKAEIQKREEEVMRDSG